MEHEDLGELLSEVCDVQRLLEDMQHEGYSHHYASKIQALAKAVAELAHEIGGEYYTK